MKTKKKATPEQIRDIKLAWRLFEQDQEQRRLDFLWELSMDLKLPEEVIEEHWDV